MALPPEMPMGDGDFESTEPDGDEALALDEGDPTGGELDPQFAADVSEALPDLDDAQLSALQRAFLGLMVR